MPSNHYEHACHNEKVCNYLNRYESYTDWVITTAFYSAMHHVRHLMLPKTISGNVFNDFEELFRNQKAPMEGRHGFQKQYVLVEHPSISFEYDRLHEFSRNARYTKYAFGREEGKKAKGYLETIKKYVDTVKPVPVIEPTEGSTK